MKDLSIIAVFLFLTLPFQLHSQNMNNNELEKIFYVVSDTLQGNSGNWQFVINGTMMLCVTDETHNRMRIVSPIIEDIKLDEEEKQKLLEANFHTALDVRYAISNQVLCAAFIHPLKELTKDQVFDAIVQVYTAVQTFGTSFSSTGLSFPGTNEENNNDGKIKELKLQKNKI